MYLGITIVDKIPMKIKNICGIFLYLAFAKIGTAQSPANSYEDVTGIYTFDRNAEGKFQNKATWELQLQKDGNFLYHFQRKLKDQEIEDYYARGTYTSKDLVVTFVPTPDTEENSTKVTFKNTKARVHKRHPRNKSSEQEPVYIHFFASLNKAIKGLKLYQTDG